MIAIASDHAGFQLKQIIMNYLKEQGLEYKDFGVLTEERCDYPVYAEMAARAVAAGNCEKGILVCGTGLGISIAANKVKGVRAALANDLFTAEMSRRHNNANMLALGGRVIGPDLALAIVALWLKTPFDGGRHAERVDLITAIEERA